MLNNISGNFIIVLSLIVLVQQIFCKVDTVTLDPDDSISLSTTTTDLYVTRGGVEYFTISTSKPVKEPLVIMDLSTNTDIATVSPMATIKAGEDSVEISIQGIHIGSCIIEVFNYTISENKTVTSDVYIRVHVRRGHMLSLLTGVFRWFYEFCFAVHLLPQLYLNYQRQSVVGLSFDYLLLSVITFATFAIYNTISYSSTIVQEAYLNKQPPPPGVDMVNLADVLISIFNTIVICATYAQCYRYEKGEQKVSRITYVLFLIVKIAIFVLFIIMLAGRQEVISFVTFVDILGYCKLLFAFSKYIPQVYMNYDRKSTEGWSIAFAILDLLCGVLTMSEMLMVSSNYGHWISFFDSPNKLGVALFSIIFSTILIIQHYVIYRMVSEEDKIPIIGFEDEENKTLQASDGREIGDQEMEALQEK